jgi:hypothetical protein
MSKRRGIGLLGSVAAIAGLGAFGFAGFNVVRTGCPFGICATAMADSSCDSKSATECEQECTGDEAAAKTLKGSCCELMADDEADAPTPAQAGDADITP